jgi:hypothetical protein
VVFLDLTPAVVFSHDLQRCQIENVIYTNPASLTLFCLLSEAGRSDIELIPSINPAHFEFDGDNIQDYFEYTVISFLC